MITKVKFKNLKNDSLFDFAGDFFVKVGKNSAKSFSKGEVYKFTGKELVAASDERIKKWYQL
ncbi:hypothetical protein [Providencia phage PSTCR6]|nr:hypothetical protein [Providencia phage PSTCR6]